MKIHSGSALAAALVPLLFAAGLERRAHDIELEEVARVRVVAAALAARGSWRVALTGAKGACSPWVEDGLPLRGSREDTEEEDTAEACDTSGTGAPPLRSESDQDSAATAASMCAVEEDMKEGPEVPLGGDSASGQEWLERDHTGEDTPAPDLRPMPLRTEDDIPRWSVGDEDVCETHWSERMEDTEAPMLRETTIESEDALGNTADRTSLAAGAQDALMDSPDADIGQAGGGTLDALFEHLEDDTTYGQALPPASDLLSRQQQSKLPSMNFRFLSPLALVLDLAAVVGFISNYLAYHTLVACLPRTLRRSDRALGVAVLLSMALSLPIKYALSKMAGDLCGSGDLITLGRFMGVTTLSALVSPLLTAVWDFIDMGSFPSLVLGSVSDIMVRNGVKD